MISPVRSAKYLKFVRGQRCAFCPNPASEAHHVSRKSGGGGMGLKGCDLLAAPLCNLHHREYHTKRWIGDRSIPETQAELWKAIALSLRAYHLQETA